MQFARYIPLVKSRCEKVVFECDKTLVRLFEGCDGIDTIVEKPYTKSDSLTPDAAIPVMSAAPKGPTPVICTWIYRNHSGPISQKKRWRFLKMIIGLKIPLMTFRKVIVF